ncbi:YfcC family protein [Facklamia sp. 7083-14-GEN3]|uniref:YfcC family protein n=1 Tax=Facklamia sp. 7083-14-GEN3 TaxID=2973478 RepID=UPI00215B9DAE|nr:YfcC family protein [Facklamia sp. 7083-14-GEN3]MCR8968686.1 YfcC family protein [Facklamia sp. 7083-14-GEN3]
MEKPKKRKMLNAFTILFIITAIIGILTWLIPSGAYDVDSEGKFIAGTYHLVDQTRQGFWDIFAAPIRGFLGTESTDGAVQVSLFVMIVGGFLGVVTETGAIDAGIASTIRNNKNNVTGLIWILMGIFAIGGSTYGMAEETMAFYPLLIPLMVGIGMDALVAVAVILVGAGLGVLSSTVNPFATTIASDMAGISMADGMLLRVIFLIVTYVIGAMYVSRYAKKVLADKNNSMIADQMEADKEKWKVPENMPKVTAKQKGVLWLFALTFVIMILSLIPWEDLNENFTFFSKPHEILLGIPVLGDLIGQSLDGLPFGSWYLVEISVLFFLMSIVIAAYYGIKEDRFVEVFIAGVKDLISVALIAAVARGIQVVMNDGQITATVLHWGEQGLANLPKGVFTVLTYIFYIPMSFLIPSTSGLAAATMGIMAPLAQFADVLESIVVTAFQSASGIVNLITPTSGVVMGALAIANIELTTWWKFMRNLIIIIFVVTIVLLLIGAYLGI